MLEIITDHKFKDLKSIVEVPSKILNDYDYLDDETKHHGWIYYRKWWYHLSDFSIIENNDHFKGWDGYLSDTFFSGVLIKTNPEDNNQYMIATFYSKG